jgi:DNA-binding transcriptional LysR family regulator
MVQLGLGGAFFPLFNIQRGVEEGLFHVAETEEDLSLDYNLIFLKERRNSQIVRIFTSTMRRMGRTSAATPPPLRVPATIAR